MRTIMALADEANAFIAEHKPWEIAKQTGSEQVLQEICSLGLNLFRVLTTYLAPVLPVTARNASAFLNVELDAPGAFAALDQPLLDHTINPYKHLMQRVDPKDIENMVDDTKLTTGSTAPDKASGPLADEPIAEQINFDDFAKIDLRVARIVEAEHVEGADKLLKLTLDLGGEQRQVFAGIKSAYKPEQLKGRMTVMIANLAPRKMRFGVSEGMVLAAGAGGNDLFVLTPDEGAKPGMRVK